VFNTGGTVMPVRTLAIQGNYTQNGGGVLAYQLSPSGASGTLAAQGIATLGGTRPRSAHSGRQSFWI
jgi:hypothetical protein